MQINNFISVDWGTSNFRMRLIDILSLDIIEMIESPVGVKSLYNEWEKNGGDRETYFLNFLKSQYILFKSQIDPSVKIVISGMASSSIGLKELPYANLPFNIDGCSLYSEQITSAKISNPIFLISGVKSNSDVIRGEEVQILGLSHLNIDSKRNIFILPGTHSKHIICDKNKVIDFKTFMTGEIFDVISEHTILKNSIVFGTLNSVNLNAFEEGIREAKNGVSILNSLFKIRANSLFEKMNNVQNYYFLSGLLIGEELKSISTDEETVLHLCAGGKLFELYKKAIQALGLDEITNIIPQKIVDSAVIRGQYKLLKTLK